MRASFSAAILVATLAVPCSGTAQGERVSFVKTPGRGIQPQALIDEMGQVHLLYYQGDASAGNLFYVRRPAGEKDFTAPLRVNSQDGSAVAIGTIRGGQLALGRKGRVHVVWNGSQKTLAAMPMLYARLSDAGAAFEPQRDLMAVSRVLDGGGTVAADKHGNVHVIWQALGRELLQGPEHRKVWISTSRDDGATFAAETPAWEESTGACPCCGMRGLADAKGNLHLLYRAASEKVNRGMYLLRSEDRGKSFRGAALDNWQIGTCPMSSETLAEGPGGIYAAWDNDGQIFFTRLQPGKRVPDTPKSVPGQGGNRKHPALAVNKNGECIVVWTEGTGWNRGGGLAWQVYDRNGNPTAEAGRRAGAIPVWSLATVIAEPDGRFTIWH